MIDNEALVFRAALLAGMGRQAHTVATDSFSEATTDEAEQGKTCIDDGGLMIFTLHSGHPDELGIIRRMTGATDTIQPWLRTHYRRTTDSIAADEWESCIFTGENQAQYQHVMEIVRTSGDEPRFCQIQAELGHRGRFIFAMQPKDPARLPAWIGWQLDKHNPPAKVLRAMHWETIWPEAHRLMQDFLGTPLSDRSGPWSIAVGFGASCGTLVRIGTTAWARQPEDRTKRRRLVKGIEQLGGDARTLESLYKLLLPTTIGPFTRVGRAIEIEFCEGQLQGADVLLLAGMS